MVALKIPLLAVGIALCGPAQAQYTLRASVDSSGGQAQSYSSSPSISGDGRLVAFASNASLVPGDTNSRVDVYVRDRGTHQTIRASLATSGAQPDDDSNSPAISADGRFVVFASFASSLVVGDTNGVEDVFLRDLQSGTTTRVSVSSAGIQGNDHSGYPSISADGRYVAFMSYAPNLVPGDANGCADVFVHDRIAHTTVRASVDDVGAEADQDSLLSALSADGRSVAFESYATNLVPGDTNAAEDVFVRDLVAGRTTRESVGPGGAQGGGDSQAPAISGDGRFVAFYSWSALHAGDANGKPDVFVRDRSRGITRLASVATSGAQANDISFRPTISADGRWVAFVSYASNLVPGDTNGPLQADAFLRDTTAGTTSRMNVGPGGAQDEGSVGSLEISADGTCVAFDSDGEHLVPGDTNDWPDVFVRDRFGGTGFTSLCDPGVAGILGCPCGNPPDGSRRGCDNSQATGGAALSANGGAFLSEDTLVFTTSGERAHATSLLLQGTLATSLGAVYGQGVRCIAGGFRRLYVGTAVGGAVALPDFARRDPTVSARSAAVGLPISAGESRWYLVSYRDPIVLGGCPSGSTYNATQTGRVTWSP
jgi:Tol biopolymer transport system component